MFFHISKPFVSISITFSSSLQDFINSSLHNPNIQNESFYFPPNLKSSIHKFLLIFPHLEILDYFPSIIKPQETWLDNAITQNESRKSNNYEGEMYIKKRKADLGCSWKFCPFTFPFWKSPNVNIFTFFFGRHSCISDKAIATEIPQISLQGKRGTYNKIKIDESQTFISKK